MEFDPFSDRFAAQPLDGSLPRRPELSDLTLDQDSRSDTIDRFGASFQFEDGFLRVEDIARFQDRNEERFRSYLHSSLGAGTNIEAAVLYSKLNVLAAYRKSSEHSIYGKSPERVHTLIELESPAGFWIWTEQSKIPRTVLNPGSTQNQSLLFATSVGLVIEETAGKGTVGRNIMSRSAFVEMIESARIDFDLLPAQVRDQTRNAIYQAVANTINTAVISDAQNFIFTSVENFSDWQTVGATGVCSFVLGVHTLDHWLPSGRVTGSYPFGEFQISLVHERSGGVAVRVNAVPIDQSVESNFQR